jgi:low temperature requirement protein LtrA
MAPSISVTWLELFLDLSVVVAIHNTTKQLEEDLSLDNFLSFFLRIFLTWNVWNLLTLK